MLSMVIGTKKNIQGRINDLEGIMRSCSSCPKIVQVLFYTVASFGRFIFEFANFIIAIPIFFLFSPQQSFERLARRKNNGQFIDSYTTHIKRYHVVVGTTLTAIVAIAVQLSIFGFAIYQSGKPSFVRAYTASTTVTASFDTTYFDDKENQEGYCWDSVADLSSGWDSEYKQYTAFFQFSLSDIPDAATVTKVELITYVSSPAPAGNAILKRAQYIPPNVDRIDNTNCVNINCYTTPTYVSADWTTTGLKTTDLGEQAKTDVQSRISGSDTISLAVWSGDYDDYEDIGVAVINSIEAASNKPQLKVTYTTAPQAPTGMAKGAISTSSIVWNWTDTATEDTGYNVHDGASGGSPVTGCTSLAANAQTCTETGLSANTLYQRHPNVTDPHDNTDGASASAYTAIETPAGLTFSSVGTTGITAASSTSLTNLTSGSSGAYFQESVTGTNSGWLTTNSWTKSGLTANTQYSFQVKARNGDSAETGLSAAAAKYTLSPPADVDDAQSAGTWYRTPDFSFTNYSPWGAGGVQYYRYVWDQTAAHSFNNTESTWSDAAAKCPGGACTTANATLSQTATADGSWYLHVRSYNGDDVANGAGTLYGPYRFDGSAPAISGLAAAPDTDSATVTWTTDEPSTTQLEYGTTTAYGLTSALDETLDTSHAVTLSGLAAGATFHVRALGRDQAGNAAQSADMSFSTAARPRTLITNVKVESISQTGAVVTWTTNEPATSKVRYGLTTDYGSEVSDPTPVTSHSVSLTGLTVGATYHYEVISVGSTTDNDADATFTTMAETPTPTPAPPPAPTPTLTISGIRVVVTSSSAKIFWKTSAAATSKVRYGRTAYTKSAASAAPVVWHELTVSKLAPSTTYRYSIESVSEVKAQTGAAAFKTLARPAQSSVIAPTITSPSLEEGANDSVRLLGTARGGHTLNVYRDGKLIKRVRLGGTSKQKKSFSLSIALTKLAAGKHTIYLRAANSSGQLSSISQAVSFVIVKTNGLIRLF